MPVASLIGGTAGEGTKQDMQTATILAFPKRSMPEPNLSVEDELARLSQNLTALAAAAREYKSAIEDLAHRAADRLNALSDEHDPLGPPG
jgi:hypothetical protein